jgi:hypothetical protein
VLELEVVTTGADVRALRRARESLPPAVGFLADESWHRVLAQRPTSAGWPRFEL